MFKLVIITCFCVASLDVHGSVNGKPIPGIQNQKNPGTPTAKMSRAVKSPRQLIELFQRAMRMLASKIDETPRAAESSIEFFQQSADSAATCNSTSEKILLSSKHRQILDSANQTEEKPFRTVREKLEESESVTGVHSTVVGSEGIRDFDVGSRSTVNRNYFEIAPNSTPSEAEAIPNSELLPLAKTVTSTSEDIDSTPSNIRVRNLTTDRISFPESEDKVMSFPFEAIITFTRKNSSSLSEFNDRNVELITTRDPPDDFPPYFDTISSNSNRSKHSNQAKETADETNGDERDETLKPMSKRQMAKLGEVLETFDFSKHGIKESRNDVRVNNSSPRDLKASGKNNAEGFVNVKFDENSTDDTRSGIVPTSFQRQEIDEEYEEDEEEEGPLGSITGLLPLVLPVLEDLSNPNTDTDIADLLEAGLPLLQGLSQPNGENDGIDLVGVLSPIIASLSGPNRKGNGTVLQSILPLIVPLITPFIGPIVGPIIQGLSNPADQGGSSITPLVQAVAGPLSLPATPGGISPAAGVISGVIASLIKDLKTDSKQSGGSDIGALVSTLVSGVIAGGSAGLGAGSMNKPVSPARQNGYGAYGEAPVPASSVDPVDLITSSAKEIFGFSLQLIKSVVSSVTGILGASSAMSAEKPKPLYGPAMGMMKLS